jgi:hypothetical protein
MVEQNAEPQKTGPQKTERRRGAWFAACVLACAAFALAYVFVAALRRAVTTSPVSSETRTLAAAARKPATTPHAEPAGAAPALQALRGAPHIIYRSSRAGEDGRLVVAALSAPDASRWVSDLHCDRAHFAASRGICVRRLASTLGSRVSVDLIGPNLELAQHFEFDGVPSRARVSADGRFAAITLFVTGDDYASAFSTRTKLFDAEGRLLPDIEFYDAQRAGQPFQRIDFNYWGITFVPNSAEAFATLGTGGTTYLVRVDLTEHRIATLNENVECPSLSPAGDRLVFKRQQRAGEWRLNALEPGSQRAWPVGSETRSIDDQVEWLDNDHVLYAVPQDLDRPELGTHLWLAPVAAVPKEPARLYLQGAASPAVIRP